MKAELKINLTTILVLVAGVVFFFWLNGRKNREIDLHLNTIAHNEFVFDTWKSTVDSVQVVQQDALNASAEALKEALKRDSIQFELIEHYKKLANVVKVEYVYKVDTLEVPVPITVDEDTSIHIANVCYDLDFSLSDGLFTLDGFSFNNRQDIVIGTQKSGLRRKETVVSIRNTNPCLTTTGMQSYNVIYEKKWWENPLITTPIGLATGYIIGKVTK